MTPEHRDRLFALQVVLDAAATQGRNYESGPDTCRKNAAAIRALLASADDARRLREALIACVRVAKAWHGEIAFDIYYDHSPEMKLIREALGPYAAMKGTP